MLEMFFDVNMAIKMIERDMESLEIDFDRAWDEYNYMWYNNELTDKHKEMVISAMLR